MDEEPKQPEPALPTENRSPADIAAELVALIAALRTPKEQPLLGANFQ